MGSKLQVFRKRSKGCNGGVEVLKKLSKLLQVLLHCFILKRSSKYQKPFDIPQFFNF